MKSQLHIHDTCHAIENGFEKQVSLSLELLILCMLSFGEMFDELILHGTPCLFTPNPLLNGVRTPLELVPHRIQ